MTLPVPAPTLTVTRTPDPARRRKLAALVDRLTRPALEAVERQTDKKAV